MGGQMAQLIGYLLAGCVILISMGCATISGSPAAFPTSENALEEIDPCYKATIDLYYSSPSPSIRIEVRNKFIEKRLGAIDGQYLAFKEALYTQGIVSNVVVDVTTLGLNVAGAATGSSSAKSILHSLSGGLIGGKAAVDKNVYFDRTMPALLSQMEALRKTVRARIIEGMARSEAAYPLAQAMNDLQDYYIAGTIPGAIVGITKDATTASKEADKDIEKALRTAGEIKAELEQKGYTVSSPGKDEAKSILLKYLKPDGKKFDEVRMNVLKRWMEEQKIHASLTFFARAEKYAAQRINAVKYLGENGYLHEE